MLPGRQASLQVFTCFNYVLTNLSLTERRAGPGSHGPPPAWPAHRAGAGRVTQADTGPAAAGLGRPGRPEISRSPKVSSDSPLPCGPLDLPSWLVQRSLYRGLPGSDAPDPADNLNLNRYKVQALCRFKWSAGPGPGIRRRPRCSLVASPK